MLLLISHNKFVSFEPFLNVNDTYAQPFQTHICVASSQNSLLVGRNKSGIIHDLSNNNFFNFSLFCLLISILINIVF